nr:TVP38/TMEM64 family protein [Texcoconibacillus texcoconensis]
MVRPFVLFPTSVLSMVGGLAFGVIPGFIATFIGAMLAAIISFFVARKLGRAFIKKAWSEKMKGVQEQLRKRGWLYVMLLRFVPVINFDLLSYSAALSSIRFQHFLIGTALGIIPGTVVMTLLGSSVVDQNTTAIFVIVTFIVILMIPFLFQDKIKKKLRID